jgi:heme-degrading monooxygenase HmoA
MTGKGNMIFHIDVVKTDSTDQMTTLWRSVAHAEREMPGFVESTLHRTYRWLNHDGYQLVGITRWDGQADYDAAALVHNACHPCIGMERSGNGMNLYTVVNQSGNTGETTGAGNIVVTNPYRINLKDADKYAEMWDASKRHMESRDGFVSARLFQSKNKDNEFIFVSRAEWTSEALFMKQFEGKDFKSIIEPLEGIFSICLSRVTDHVRKGS